MQQQDCIQELQQQDEKPAMTIREKNHTADGLRSASEPPKVVAKAQRS